MSLPHTFSLQQVQKSINRVCQSFGEYYIWFTDNECLIALEKSTGHVHVWGWNSNGKFFIVDEETFEASIEGIHAGQGELEQFFDGLVNPNYCSGSKQIMQLRSRCH